MYWVVCCVDADAEQTLSVATILTPLDEMHGLALHLKNKNWFLYAWIII
jgi:hypothetical protein